MGFENKDAFVLLCVLIMRILPIILAIPLSTALSPWTPPSTRRSFLKPFVSITAGLSIPAFAEATAGPSVSVIVSDGMKAFQKGDIDKSVSHHGNASLILFKIVSPKLTLTIMKRL